MSVYCGTIMKFGGGQHLGLWGEGVAKKVVRSQLERKSNSLKILPALHGPWLVSTGLRISSEAHHLLYAGQQSLLLFQTVSKILLQTVFMALEGGASEAKHTKRGGGYREEPRVIARWKRTLIWRNLQ